MKDQNNTKATTSEHPIVKCFPQEPKEKEYTWPANWSWRDDMVTC